MKNNTWAVWGPPEAWGPWARAQRTHLIRRPWEGGSKSKVQRQPKSSRHKEARCISACWTVGRGTRCRDHHQSAVKFCGAEAIVEAFCGPWDSNANGLNMWLPVSIEYLASFRVADSSATAPGSLEEAYRLNRSPQAAVISYVRDLPRYTMRWENSRLIIIIMYTLNHKKRDILFLTITLANLRLFL